MRALSGYFFLDFGALAVPRVVQDFKRPRLNFLFTRDMVGKPIAQKTESKEGERIVAVHASICPPSRGPFLEYMCRMSPEAALRFVLYIEGLAEVCVAGYPSSVAEIRLMDYGRVMAEVCAQKPVTT